MNEGHFDYQSISEEKEELDFSKLVPCPKCKKLIPHDATMCLYCGEEVIFQEKKSWVTWVGVVLIIAFILFALLS
ncbi:MAG: hypothetical protein KAT96_02435 [Candidatus Omnitrophica bacterium]|nr:hypothetical protein [Candidatus Omnitrophota bacterium]